MKTMPNKMLVAAVVALSFPVLQGCGDGGTGGAGSSTTPPEPKWNTLSGEMPLVTGHRGASGYLPEHTLEAYTRAIEQGADFIEPDLVSTKDGHLVARHEPEIGLTTDVAMHPEFADRKVKKMVDGIEVEGFFASDFTLAEIKTLRAIQPRAYRPQEFNGQYTIPTFDEVIALAKEQSAKVGRTIGIYPETKHSTFHVDLGLPLEDKLLAALEAAGWTKADSPVIIQSFESKNLQELRKKTAVRIVQLIDGANDVTGKMILKPPTDKPYDFVVAMDPRTNPDLLTDEGLKFIKTYADGVSPWKRYIVPSAGVDANGDGTADDTNGDMASDESDRTALPPNDIIERAHAVGLFVHSWTFRNEKIFLAKDYEKPADEYEQFYELGIDGVFSDFPDEAVKAREAH
ncbi:glycerophosphodiester phosphodiesterase [Polyangium aurulentum]|uniref:glycerophosphodiester phosphodiesterase n=1 Tax=Polyangium aurulentum TaxID=2567896 RepID=UPI00197FB680|nr:glycerophosphodiester phosphodiesterase [Polyangium aurulentum]UQA62832.1 glycerophosphodiester phosphodiesterase [Polyangium aurulentum]